MVSASSLPQVLEDQLTQFISLQKNKTLAQYQDSANKKEIRVFFDWILDFARLYCSSRMNRADDLASHHVEIARKLAWDFIGKGNHDFFATCVDGRNMPTVMFSKVPHVGGVLRAPAGTVTGFMEGAKPHTVTIDHDSFVVQEITRLLLEKPGETIFYGLDSHLGCAARGLIHATEGGKQADAGLRSDVMAKFMTARGILKLAQDLRNQGKQVADIVPVFFSYDPHSGFVVAGLEANMHDSKVSEIGYTDAMLDELAKKGRIVRTSDLILDSGIIAELEKVIKPKSAHFREDFAQSLIRNWKAIVALYNGGESMTFKLIQKKLEKAYKLSGWNVTKIDNIETKSISKRTLAQKAKFLLKNVLTRYSIAGVPSGHDHAWPFDKHQESMAVITDGGYAPFSQLDAFSVFSRDTNALLPNAKLTIDLIRAFRKAGNSLDPISKRGLSKEQFESAPVLIVNKAILRLGDEQVWQLISHLDLEQITSRVDWDDESVLRWTRADVYGIVLTAILDQGMQVNARVAQGMVSAIWELFDRMRIMMKDKAFRHMLLRGNIVLVSLIVDANRCPRLILPFVA